MSHASSFNDYINGLRKQYNDLNNKKSNYDLAEQDILHYIEFEKYDAPTGSKLLKKLKEIRLARREIKDEYEELQSILHKIKNAGLNNYKRPQKNYTYRTITIESILN
jgi:hypothetical protein